MEQYSNLGTFGGCRKCVKIEEKKGKKVGMGKVNEELS